ncbi:hypothetical protein FM120_06535 [Sphingobacterium faecium PCAi_F2.5]|nr:hypothetical protein FM120_06535 [Sphingobacterium faecium PCAi_F2.5]
MALYLVQKIKFQSMNKDNQKCASRRVYSDRFVGVQNYIILFDFLEFIFR